jgi:serine/threonine protein kinase
MSGADDSSFDRTLGVQAYASPSDGPARRAGTHVLPAGTRIGEFRIEQVLGEGGFGIVYLATDLQLGRLVALKEYLPAAMAGRGPDLSVMLFSEHDRATFEAGLRSFVNEAHLLAQLDHPSLVKVHRFWEERGTACMVMPYLQGQTLKQALQQAAAGTQTAPDEAWLRALLGPLLDVLAYLHAQNVYHRDVSPENILLLPDGRPMLLDLGAARLIADDATQNLTAILKQGYAPVEQYAESGAYKQGAWTDLYALAAVFYLAVAGKPPMPSVARLMKDDMLPAVQVGQGRFSHGLLAWIDTCLAVQPEQRPRDVAAARRLLAEPVGEVRADGPGAATAPRSMRGEGPQDVPTALPVRSEERRTAAPPSPPARWRWVVAPLVALTALSAIAWFTTRSNAPIPAGSAEPPSGANADPAPAAAAVPVAASAAALAPASAPTASTEPVAPPNAAAPAGPAAAATPAAPAAPNVSQAAPKPAPAPAPAKPAAREPATQANQCADLLQRLSLGEDTAALREKLASLRCR